MCCRIPALPSAPALFQWLSLKRIAYSDLHCICIHHPRRPSVSRETSFLFGVLCFGGWIGSSFVLRFSRKRKFSYINSVRGRVHLVSYYSIFILEPCTTHSQPFPHFSQQKRLDFHHFNLSDDERLRRPQHDCPGPVSFQHGPRRLRHNGCQEAWRASTTSEIIDSLRDTLELESDTSSAIIFGFTALMDGV